MSPTSSRMDRMRRKQAQLRSVAGKMLTMARHAERLARDSPSYWDFCPPVANRACEKYKEEEIRRRAPTELLHAMRTFAGFAGTQARLFGKCLRRNSQQERDLGVFWSLCYVYLLTYQLPRMLG
jgi:hypothetical protein